MGATDEGSIHKKASSEVDEDEVFLEGGFDPLNGELYNMGGSVASGHTRRRIGVKGPKMPCFDDRSDDMDSFLHRFKVYAESRME